MAERPLFPLPVGGLPIGTIRKVILGLVVGGLLLAFLLSTVRDGLLVKKSENQEDDRTSTALYYYVSHNIGTFLDELLQNYGLCENMNRCTVRIDYGDINKGLTANQWTRKIEVGLATVFMVLDANPKYGGREHDTWGLTITQDSPRQDGYLGDVAPQLHNALNAIMIKLGFDWPTVQRCLKNTKKDSTTTSCSVRDNELAGQRLNNGSIGRSRRIVMMQRPLLSREPNAWATK